MQLENLEVLLAINKHGSLRKAADALLTSYQNVSRILRQIEEEFGVPLFVRSSTGMSPTDEGKLAVITARQMLNLYN
ncbi:MAG: LysR family transcriptional regulator, partial [Peptococcaceae bacterium]